MRTTLGLAALFLVLILAIYAYVGTRDQTLGIDHPALVYQERLDHLICCSIVHESSDERYLLMLTRNPDGEFRQVALRVFRIGENGEPSEVNAIGSPFDSLLPTGFALVEDKVYVPLYANDQSGIWTADISDPEWPEGLGFVETGSEIARQLAASEAAVAINHTDEIVFLDLADPSRPAPVSSLEQEPSPVIRLEMHGERLYVNDADEDTIRIYDVSDPARPEEIGSFVNEEGPGEVEIPFGVADAEELLDTTAVPGRYLDFQVDGDLAYVAASDLGLHVLDVSSPESVEIVSRLELPDRAIRVAVDGDRLSVLGGSEENVEQLAYAIHTVDISDPSSPVLLDSIDGVVAEPGLQAFSAVDGYVYAGLGEHILAFDVRE